MSTENKVVEIRRRAGLSQQELADLSGVARVDIAAYERGTQRPSTRTLERLAAAATPRPSVALEQHLVEVARLVRRHRATNPRVVGSVARGEDRPGSDLDLLVRFAPDASLFDQVGLAQDLEDLLGVHVDVISEGGLRERHEGIRTQARPL